MSKKKDPFRYQYANTVMDVNGLKMTLHMPDVVKRIMKADGTEGVASLPPSAPRPAFAVDEYPACPDNWMHGSATESSYFVPIIEEKGMWLDFTFNEMHEYDVAVLVSVQGINPLTGEKSDPIRLEQYREMCPKHQKSFKQDLYCEDCNFKWSPQNYITTTATGYRLWIDGFRTENGVVRQWYFTEEECKGVAHQIIGDDKVYAIGVVFYLSKKPKPRPKRATRRSFLCGGLGGSYGAMTKGITASSMGANYNSDDLTLLSADVSHVGSKLSCTTDMSEVPESYLVSMDCGGLESMDDYGAMEASLSAGLSAPSIDDIALESVKADVEETQKRLEIGAGAKINQIIGRDVNNLDYWRDEPAGFIYINYCDVETAEKIIAAGKRQEKSEGFLAGLDIKDAD